MVIDFSVPVRTPVPSARMTRDQVIARAIARSYDATGRIWAVRAQDSGYGHLVIPSKVPVPYPLHGYAYMLGIGHLQATTRIDRLITPWLARKMGAAVYLEWYGKGMQDLPYWRRNPEH